MIQERLTRRGLLKLATAPLLAPLAAACAPQNEGTIQKLQTRVTELEAEKKTPEPEPQLPVNIRVLQPEEFNRATEEAMKQKAEPLPSPTTKSRPTVVVKELTPSPEVKRGILWQKEVRQNFLFGKEFPFAINDTPTFLLSNKRLFTRDKNGYAQEIDQESSKVNWEWEGVGMVLAANEDRLYIQSEDNYKIYVLDTKTKKPINAIETEQQINTNLGLRLRYRWPSYATKDTFINLVAQPQTNSITDGFRVMDKDGKHLWWSKDVARVLDVTDGTIVAGNEAGAISTEWMPSMRKIYSGFIDLFKDQTGGYTRIPCLSREVRYKLPAFTYAHNGNVIVCAGIKENAKIPTISLYDLKSHKERWQITTPLLAKPQKIYLSNTLKRVTVEEQLRQTSGAQKSFLRLRLDLSSGESIPEFKVSAETEEIFAGENQELAFMYHVQSGELLFVKSSTEVEWRTDFVVGIKYLGVSGGNLIFANWDKQRSSEFEWGTPKIYAVDPKNKKLAWKPVEIPAAYLTAVRPDKIIVVTTDKLITIDSKKGEVAKTTKTNGIISHVFDTGDIVLVELDASETQHQLIAFRP